MSDSTVIERFKALPTDRRKEILARLDDQQKAALKYCWSVWARPDQLPPDGDWLVWLIMAGRGFGKRLCIETAIPTPDGWSLMGDLRAGDMVFDERGIPVPVLAAHEIVISAKSYEVAFNDGSVIVADAEHLWLTWDKAARKAHGRAANPTLHPAVRTTAEIARTLTVARADGRIERNHSIPASAPLQLAEAELPVPPYTMGVWLGDGYSRDPYVELSDRDSGVIMDGMMADGVIARHLRDGNGASACYALGLGGSSLRAPLRNAGVLNDKHIPITYLRASEAQRRSLLRGLLDTDGYVCADSGRIELTLCNDRLARDAYHLICGLGYIATMAESDAILNGRATGRRWRIGFMAGPEDEILSVPFKRSRLMETGAQTNRRTHRYIVDVRLVDSRPMRCITVDSESGLFLAGESCIPTHNTRTGSEWVRGLVDTGKYGRIALVAGDAADARDVMVEGESGLMGVFPPWQRPTYYPSMRRVVFHNGAQATLFSAEDPDALRGPQHHAAWVDELAKFQKAQETWDQLMFGLRLGQQPRVCITTTPRPIKLMRDIVDDKRTVVTRGSTYDNLGNLAPTFRDAILRAYEGTHLGRQEIDGELLWEVRGSLFTLDVFERCRVSTPPPLDRIVVAVDPAGTANRQSDETGICVVGCVSSGGRTEYYVLRDMALRTSPHEWARQALALHDLYEADAIVAESNFGGDMVREVIRGASGAIDVPVIMVRATRAKHVRAEPVSLLYERGLVHHVGPHPELESQLHNFTTGGDLNEESPGRADALVWAITHLMRGADSAVAEVMVGGY